MFATIPRLVEVASQPFKRAQTGLFHGKTKLSGNNVPFSLKKTRRTWLPNIQHKRIKSDILDQTFKIKVTTRALKTIKKYGGLDNYVKNTPHNVLGDEGMRIRLLIRDAERSQKKKPEDSAVEAIQKALEVVQQKPCLQSAYELRVAVGKKLGLSGPADSTQTVEFLKRKDPKLKLAHV